MCSAESLDVVKPAADRISELLRERHRVRAGSYDDFNIRRPEDVLKAQIAANRTLSLLLGIRMAVEAKTSSIHT